METRAPLLGEPLPVELMNTIWADRDGVHDALGESRRRPRAWLRAVAPGRMRPVRTGPTDLQTPFPGDVEQRHEGGSSGCADAGSGDSRRGELTATPARRQHRRQGNWRPRVSAVTEVASAVPRWTALAWAPEGVRAVTLQPHQRSAGPTAAISRHRRGRDRPVQRYGRTGYDLRACLAPGMRPVLPQESPPPRDGAQPPVATVLVRHGTTVVIAGRTLRRLRRLEHGPLELTRQGTRLDVTQVCGHLGLFVLTFECLDVLELLDDDRTCSGR